MTIHAKAISRPHLFNNKNKELTMLYAIMLFTLCFLSFSSIANSNERLDGELSDGVLNNAPADNNDDAKPKPIVPHTGIFGVFPQCNTPAVEFRIRDRFNEAEEKQWQRGFELSKLTGMHEHDTGYWKDSEILRRYCNATAHFSNGQRRQVYYLLEEEGGFVGKNWGLTYCVAGLDPWNNHDANCRTLR